MPSLSINFNPAVGPIVQLAIFPHGFQPAGGQESSSTHPLNITSYAALIDTGASHTSISQKIITDLKLTPISKQQVGGVHGPKATNLFKFSVALIFPQTQLPTGAMNANVAVFPTTGPEFVPPGGFDVLLGRDVICRGSFHMSFDGHAVLSI